MANAILNFHFDYLNPSLRGFWVRALGLESRLLSRLLQCLLPQVSYLCFLRLWLTERVRENFFKNFPRMHLPVLSITTKMILLSEAIITAYFDNINGTFYQGLVVHCMEVSHMTYTYSVFSTVPPPKMSLDCRPWPPDRQVYRRWRYHRVTFEPQSPWATGL